MICPVPVKRADPDSATCDREAKAYWFDERVVFLCDMHRSEWGRRVRFFQEQGAEDAREEPVELTPEETVCAEVMES